MGEKVPGSGMENSANESDIAADTRLILDETRGYNLAPPAGAVGDYLPPEATDE